MVMAIVDDGYPSDDDCLSENDVSILNSDFDVQQGLGYIERRQRNNQERSNPFAGSASAREDINPQPSTKQTWTSNQASRSTTGSVAESRPGKIETGQSNVYRYTHKTQPCSEIQDQTFAEILRDEWRHMRGRAPLKASSRSQHNIPSYNQILSAPKLQRSFLACILLVLLLWGNWTTWIRQRVHEELEIRHVSKNRLTQTQSWFGQNMRPKFFDMTQVAQLDDFFVPGANDDPIEGKRLITIGDVHGCHEELLALLDKIGYNSQADHLIFAGDLVSKGPNSAAVVQIAMEANASCVRGNHEDRLLLNYRDILSSQTKTDTSLISKEPKPHPPAPGTPEQASFPVNFLSDTEMGKTSGSGLESFARLDITDRILASQLSGDQLSYLQQCPLILEVGTIRGIGDIKVVHAGLAPGIPLDRQDPMSVMTMRTVDLKTHLPSSKSKGTPWYRFHNRYQAMLPPEQRTTVLYGHDSRRGLRLERYSKGLDTRCVRGGKLSALILDGNEQGRIQIVDVPCKNYRNLDRELLAAYQARMGAGN